MTTRRTGFRDVGLKNFSITRLRILIELARQGSMWNHELASILGLTSGTTSETLARIAKDGEIKRVRTLTDNGYAKYRYSLTIAGQQQLHRTYRHATGREFFEPSVEATARSAVVSDSPIQQAVRDFSPRADRAVT